MEGVVILNPDSGPPFRRWDAPALERQMLAHGVRVKVLSVEKHADVRALARREIERGCRTLIAAGGDGTVSAVASVAAKMDGVSLGVLPLGTLNHFARDLRIPSDVDKAIDVIARGKQECVDAARVNGRVFVNNSSIGIYPSIVLIRERERRKGRAKWTAFLRAVLLTVRRSPYWTVRVHAQGQSIRLRTPFVFVGNNQYEIEGLQIGTRGSLSAGSLFLYVAESIGRFGLVWMAFAALIGRLDKTRSLRMFSVHDAWVETRRKRVRVSADGEVLFMASPLHYELLPGALKVFVP